MEHRDDDLPEGEYPSAPIPPHERGWRHPSEVGASTWTATEPPLVLGRGLMAATATIGVVLAGGLVWAMLPASGSPMADTVTTLTIAESAVAVTAATTTPVATTPVATTTTPTTPGTVAPTSVPADPPPAVPVVLLADNPAAMATSVVVGEQVFLVTTMAAVGTQQRIRVIGNDGATATATLVWADESLAVLAAPTADVASSLATAAMPAPGTGVSVVSSTGELGAAVLAAGLPGTVIDGMPAEQLAEGSPILDPDGRVVGLCSGTSIVPVDLPDEVLAVLAELRGWMGVRLRGGDADEPVVDGMEPGSPADVAGLLDGDRILRVGDRTVDTIGELRWLLARHLPGDVLELEVMRGDRPLDDIEVTLGERPTNL